MLDKSVNRGGFGAVLAHELQPRRGVIKQIAYRDKRPFGRAALLYVAADAAFQFQTRSHIRAALTRPDVHAADGANRRQRLPAKA